MQASVSFIVVMMFLLSCTKDAFVSEKENSILGKWSIVTDSSYEGVGIGNHPVNYVGHESDYFDFSAEGKLYVKENNLLNTYNYTSTSATALIIDSFGITINGTPNTSIITYETPHSIIIYTPFITTPSGTFGRKVQLTR